MTIHVDAATAVFLVFAVILLVSIVLENRLWCWYVRLCRGEHPAPQGQTRLPR